MRECLISRERNQCQLSWLSIGYWKSNGLSRTKVIPTNVLYRKILRQWSHNPPLAVCQLSKFLSLLNFCHSIAARYLIDMWEGRPQSMRLETWRSGMNYGLIGEAVALEISTCIIVKEKAIFFKKDGEYYFDLCLKLLRVFTIILENWIHQCSIKDWSFASRFIPYCEGLGPCVNIGRGETLLSIVCLIISFIFWHWTFSLFWYIWE